MKKLISLALVVLLLAGLLVMPVSADDEIAVLLRGKLLEFDVPPQIINGRTLVPMRTIFEELGATVDWNGDTKTVTSVREDKTIILTIDSYTMYVNDEAVTLDVAPCLINGRTMVPARAVSESFDLKVDWDNEWRAVLITDLINAENNKYDAVKDLIIKYGEYDSAQNRYIKYGGLGYGIYYCDEDLIELYFEAAEDEKIMVSVLLYKERVPVVYMKYVFSDGSENVMIGQYNEKGSPFEVLETNVEEELYNDAISLINEAVQYYLDFSLKAISGISLADFGVTY